MDYIYEELEPTQAQAFEAALDKCPECKEKLEAFQRTRAAMRELEDLAPPPTISQLLLEEAARGAAAETLSFGERLRRMMRVLIMHPAIAAAATLVLVLGVSFVVYRKGMPPAARTPSADSPLPVAPAGASAPTQAPGAVGASNAAPRQEQAKEQGQKAQRQLDNAGPRAGLNAGVRAGLAGNGEPKAAADDRDGRFQAAGPVYKRPRTGATADALKNAPELSRRWGKLGARKDSKKIAEKPRAVATLQTRRRPGRGRRSVARPTPTSPRRDLYRRTRRRAGNVLDVGGGSSGVWGGRARYRYQQKGKGDGAGSQQQPGQQRAQAPTVTPVDQVAAKQRHASQARPPVTRASSAPPARGKAAAGKPSRGGDDDTRDKTAPAEREARKVKKKKARDVVARLLAEGNDAVARGDCQTAFARYNEAVRRRPYVIGSVSGRIGRCYRKLLKSKRYRALAQGISATRNPRQYNRKRAAPAKK